MVMLIIVIHISMISIRQLCVHMHTQCSLNLHLYIPSFSAAPGLSLFHKTAQQIHTEGTVYADNILAANKVWIKIRLRSLSWH